MREVGGRESPGVALGVGETFGLLRYAPASDFAVAEAEQTFER